MTQHEIDQLTRCQLANHIEKQKRNAWTTEEQEVLASRPSSKVEWSEVADFWNARIRNAPVTSLYYATRHKPYMEALEAVLAFDPQNDVDRRVLNNLKKPTPVRSSRPRRDFWSEIETTLNELGGKATMRQLCEGIGCTAKSLAKPLQRAVHNRSLERCGHGVYRFWTGQYDTTEAKYVEFRPGELWDLLKYTVKENSGKATMKQFVEASGRSAVELGSTVNYYLKTGRLRRAARGVYELNY